jgi:rhodanese-related sulfurtransferase
MEHGCGERDDGMREVGRDKVRVLNFIRVDPWLNQSSLAKSLSDRAKRTNLCLMSFSATIDPTLSMRELLAVYPGAQRALFRKYHIGGCASCGFSPDETLAAVCARHENLPVSEVVEYLSASQEEDAKMLITPRELAAALSTDPNAKLIDIRTREEFDAVHINDAIFFTQELMQEILASWNRNALLAIIDHQGARSLDAAAFFAGHGFTNVLALRGGIDAWSCEVDPNLPRYELE